MPNDTNYLIKGSTLSNIADSIRAKTESTDLIKPTEMAEAIESITTGIDTSDATATANEILEGKTAYVDGEKIIGSIPTISQATPSITIDSNGLITATATQTAGYINTGTVSATKQLAFQPAKTITPTATSQTAVSSGYSTGGEIAVKGDSNLVADNIKSGVSIFGINGTYEGSTDIEDKFIKRTFGMNIYTNNRLSYIGSYAFACATYLYKVNMQSVTEIIEYAFYNAYHLK